MKNVSLDKSPLSQLGNSKTFPVSALECLCDKTSVLLENFALLKQHMVTVLTPFSYYQNV